ncbi:uncharacterized protein [Blastocystis hominis]|uniref:Uncharacterized protein n=1 Tax=Blastocystis hominis TaxID=12968 RepID=D8M6I8_BLAHO|nr:uncharacterized protein [Blastocystis hominis]CBK23406.2 unnamed protein product [Blastocystis hominis]|eukprot:XP_012897454.1 uncharacterized protein [Blastocystis hominis]
MVANTPQSVQWLQPTIPFQQSYPYSYYQIQQQSIQNQQEKKETTEDSKEVVNATEITDEGSELVPTDELVISEEWMDVVERGYRKMIAKMKKNKRR